MCCSRHHFGILLLAFVGAVGALAGSYPAFYLTMFSPIDVMKGKIRTRLRGYGIRNALVIFQFFISAGLIISTLAVYTQLRYLQGLSLGFDKRNIINLLHTANLKKNATDFKKELLAHEGVTAASFCNRLPPNIDWQDVFSTGKPSKDYMLAVYEMDYDHLKTMRYKMTKGRFFSPEFPSDSTAIILNEQAIEKLGIKYVGDQRVFSAYGSTRGIEREIIGVMQDFNFQSLKNRIQPMAIVLGRRPIGRWRSASKDGSHNEVIDHLKSYGKNTHRMRHSRYTYVDQNFAGKARSSKSKSGLLFLLFTVLAILIACLGLFRTCYFHSQNSEQKKSVSEGCGGNNHSTIHS